MTKLIILAILGILSATALQVGVSPRVSSPALVRQMQNAALSGCSEREMVEIKKLHDTDAELLRKIIANSRKNSALEVFVNSLDITIDTRMLTEAVGDIRELKKAQKEMDDVAKEERKASRDMIRNIWSGTILLVIGAAITGFLAFLRWYWHRNDPGSRPASKNEVDNLDKALHHAITEHDEVRTILNDNRISNIASHVAEVSKRLEDQTADAHQ